MKRTNKKNCQTVSSKMSEVYLREFAASIVELFENLLDKHDVTIPSDEDDQKEADNTARLYGMVYAELEDAVAGILCDFAKKVTESANVVLVDSYNGFSSVDECDKTGTKCVYNGFIEIDGECSLNAGGNTQKKMSHLCLDRRMRKELASVSVDHMFHKVATDLLKCLRNLKLRIVKLYAGMTGEYVVIRTNAPDSIIIQQIRANNLASESGQIIRNDFSLLEDEGYMVDVICNQDDDCDIEPDAEFDMYQY